MSRLIHTALAVAFLAWSPLNAAGTERIRLAPTGNVLYESIDGELLEVDDPMPLLDERPGPVDGPLGDLHVIDLRTGEIEVRRAVGRGAFLPEQGDHRVAGAGLERRLRFLPGRGLGALRVSRFSPLRTPLAVRWERDVPEDR